MKYPAGNKEKLHWDSMKQPSADNEIVTGKHWDRNEKSRLLIKGIPFYFPKFLIS